MWFRRSFVQRRFVLIAAASAMIVLACDNSLVVACGFCVTPSGALTVVHGRSLEVAVAIRRDLDSGLLKISIKTAKDKRRRHARDVQTGRILAARFLLRDGFELLLIEDGAHYQIDGPTHLRGRKRIAAPSIRWVTGRAVMQSLLMNELDYKQAVKRGLIVVEKMSTANGRSSKQLKGAFQPKR